jgi:hypothetical protein
MPSISSIRAIQCAYDKHVASLHMPADVAATQAAHKAKMAAKAALRADPAARAARLETINAPVIQRRRLATITAAAGDLATKHNGQAAQCMSPRRASSWRPRLAK